MNSINQLSKPFIRYFITMLCGSLLALLTGCQTTQLINNQANSPQLIDLDHWKLKARIAIRNEDESVSGTLDWSKSDQDFDFHVYGLLGVTYAHLIQKNNQAVLKLPENQVYHDKNYQQLLHQILNWDFPLEALTFWVKGLPAGLSNEVIKRDSSGQIILITFQDWRIEFSRFRTFSGFSMPKLIKATHPQMSLKILPKKWQFLPSSSN